MIKKTNIPCLSIIGLFSTTQQSRDNEWFLKQHHHHHHQQQQQHVVVVDAAEQHRESEEIQIDWLKMDLLKPLINYGH